MRFFFAWVALSLLLPASPLHAWGPEGHAIVAGIALDHLDPAARQRLQQLLGKRSLFAISSWADQIRPALPEASSWHFVNIPSTANGYLASRDCPGGNCVVAKILFFSGVLRDPRPSLAAHQIALQFLVHFVGDIHQPFHALADARGGNDIPVTFFGSRRCGSYSCNLHGVWDVSLIEHTRLNRRQYTAALEQMISADHLDAGSPDPDVWANESFKLAKDAVVEPGTDLDEAYDERERPIMDRQLALAGLRLARLLNQDLEALQAGSAVLPSHSGFPYRNQTAAR